MIDCLIEIGEEIVACNGSFFNGDTIFQLRQLLCDEDVEEVKLVVRNGDTRREVLLRRELILGQQLRKDSKI
jgi:hypothetical protein